jgi:hypothetical protein
MRARLIGADKAKKIFGALSEVVRKPFAGIRGKRQIAALRAVLRQEATQGAGFSRGGARPFAPTLAFGDRPARTPPLGGPGSTYWQSWLGGRGSFASASSGRVVVASTLPWAHVHRGGVSAPSAKVTVIRAKKIARDGRPAMVHKLRGLYGVHISDATARRGLRIPSRPHADPAAPQYQDAVKVAFELELREAAK